MNTTLGCANGQLSGVGQSRPPTRRFTRDGSVVLEQQLAQLCDRVRSAILRTVPSARLNALVLGGGYGRGQGGVLKTPQGDAPYNDLEFYVFVRGSLFWNGSKYRVELERIGTEFSSQSGLHVEFKLDSIGQLARRAVSIFSYDLVSAHQVIHGSPDVFADCSKHLDAKSIAPDEPARLLLNRCSGLLLSEELLHKDSLTEDDCDFIGRNVAKAKLALGDALLACHGKYHWDCLVREQRLQDLTLDLPCLLAVQLAYGEGVRFKLHPSRLVKARQELELELRQLVRLAFQVWLWIENRRLKCNFSTIEQYASNAQTKCLGHPVWRNFLLNIRTFGLAAVLDRNARHYPRERLLNVLPLLLGSGEFKYPNETCGFLRRQLRTRAEHWTGFVAAYKKLWSSYA